MDRGVAVPWVGVPTGGEVGRGRARRGAGVGWGLAVEAGELPATAEGISCGYFFAKPRGLWLQILKPK